jgi:hypothetical protein
MKTLRVLVHHFCERLRTTRLAIVSMESGLRHRGRRSAPVFDVRAEARTCLGA